jgi:Neuraminidase (sialidase)
MTLPQETIEMIEKEAEVYAETHGDHLSNIKEYSTHNDIAGGYNAGATEWAGKAHPVIDVAKEIVMLFDPARRHVLIPADMILRLSTALAKYKEVSNG